MKRRGYWSPDEDRIITEQMNTNATWSEIVKALGGCRTTKQCRERWCNHLDPNLKKSKWTPEEDRHLVEAQSRLGNSWTKIAAEMPGRSENEVKNRWYSAVHKMTSGRKRKEQDCNRSNSGSSNAYADSDDLHHTNYSPIEADIIAFSNDVQAFLMGRGFAETEEGIEVEQVFVRMGNEYLSRYYNREMIPANSTLVPPFSTEMSFFSSSGMVSRSSIGFDLETLREVASSLHETPVNDGSHLPDSLKLKESDDLPSWLGFGGDSPVELSPGQTHPGRL